MTAEVYGVAVDPTATNNPHSYALSMVGSGHRVLEVGCSVGHVTEHLVAAGNRVVGVEIDPVAAETARQFADRVHVIDLDEAPLETVEPASFDVIVLGDVLEHLRDPDESLASLLGHLEPDGRVVISVPNVAHVDVRLMLLNGQWRYRDTGLLDRTHLRWFTRESLRSLLTNAGLVATRLEQVRVPAYGTNVASAGEVPLDDLLAYIHADPDSTTLQYVVEATRRDQVEAGHRDPLDEPAPVSYPPINYSAQATALAGHVNALEQRVSDLEAARAALERHLAAWENSTLARVAAPARSIWGRLRRRPSG